MLIPKECSNCQGWGCKECDRFGWFVADESTGSLYFVKKGAGPLALGGLKMPSPWIIGLLRSILREPHDLVWVSRLIKENRRVNQPQK